LFTEIFSEDKFHFLEEALKLSQHGGALMLLFQFWLIFEVEETLRGEFLLGLLTSESLHAPRGGVLEIEKIVNVAVVIVLEVMAVIHHGVRGLLHVDIVAVVVEMVDLSLAPEVMDRVGLVGCL